MSENNNNVVEERSNGKSTRVKGILGTEMYKNKIATAIFSLLDVPRERSDKQITLNEENIYDYVKVCDSVEIEAGPYLVLLHYIEEIVTKEPLDPRVAHIRGTVFDIRALRDKKEEGKVHLVHRGLGSIATCVPLPEGFLVLQKQAIRAVPLKKNQGNNFRYSFAKKEVKENGSVEVVPIDETSCRDTTNNLFSDPDDKAIGKVIYSSGNQAEKIINNFLELNGNNLRYDKDFDGKSISVSVHYDGIHVRVIKYGDEVYLMSPKTLQINRSFWGSREKTFSKMYEEAKGPKERELFFDDPTSETGYSFMVVHPDMLISSRQIVNSPYSVFLSKFEVFPYPNTKSSPGNYKIHELTEFNDKTCGAHPVNTTACCYSEIGGRINAASKEPGPLYREKTIKEFLTYGYRTPKEGETAHRDLRYREGESIAINFFNKKEEIVQTLRLYSVSAYWRYALRGNNPNIANQFFCLRELISSSEKRKNYNSLLSLPILPLLPFPPGSAEAYLNLMNKHTLHEVISPILAQIVERESLEPKRSSVIDDSDIKLWVNFCISLPASQLEEGKKILGDFSNTISSLTACFYNLIVTIINGKFGFDAKSLLDIYSSSLSQPNLLLPLTQIPRTDYSFVSVGGNSQKKVRKNFLIYANESYQEKVGDNDYGLPKKNKDSPSRGQVIVNKVINFLADYLTEDKEARGVDQVIREYILAHLTTYEDSTSVYKMKVDLLNFVNKQNKKAKN